MEFSFVSLFIFVVFILPGFLAQRSRQTIFPRSLQPVGTLEEAGSLVFSSALVHSLLCALVLAFTSVSCVLIQDGPRRSALLLWHHPWGTLSYLWTALVLGYLLGFIEGWMLLRQPIRTWLLKIGLRPLLERVGVPALLDERPVWFDVLSRDSSTTVFVEVALKGNAGYYTGKLVTYAILDDTKRNKDFCLTEVHFKKQDNEPYSIVPCTSLLLNFEDVYSLRVSFHTPLAGCVPTGSVSKTSDPDHESSI